MQVTIYTKPGCHLCDDVLDILDHLAPQYNLDVIQVNILDDMALYEAYKEIIPVVEVGDGKFGRLVAPIAESELQAYINMSSRLLIPPPPSFLPPRKEPAMDRFAEYIAKHWLRMVCI
ncbi:MAG: glutaredoxin family protein, partial [Chloroflexia bacterium]